MRAITVVATAAALTAAAGLAGCSGSGSSAGSTGAGGGGGAVAQAPALGAAQSLDGVIAPGMERDASLPIVRLPHQRSSVIKTGRLTIEIGKDSFSKAIVQAGDVADRLGGVVVSSDSSKRRPRMATIVVRVPAAAFQKAMHDLSGIGGGTVRDAGFDSQDVGQEFVDLAARRANLRAQEVVLRQLMGRAVTVTDTIRVQNELSQVQGQIEQIQGRLRYLHDQADLSTITVSLREAGAHAPGQPTAIGSAFRRGWDHAVSVITAVIAGAGVVIPLALLLALALAAGRWLWPALRSRLPERGTA